MSKHFKWYGALLGTLLMLGQAVASEPEAQRWLERISDAARSLSYEGTFVYRHSGRIEAMRIVHRGGAGEMERIVSITGAPREIIRDDKRVTCIFADDRSVVVDRRQLGNPFSGVVPANVGSLAAGYRLEMAGESRVAGRAAQGIAIIPKDRFRYGYRLWLDQGSGLLLRSDLLNEKGEPVEQLMFTEIRLVEHIPDEAFKPQLSGEGYTWIQDGPPQHPSQSAPQWQASSLPPGFTLISHEIKKIPGSPAPVAHLVYGDGLAMVSAYVEPAGAADALAGRSRVGAMNAFGREVAEHQVTVVGAVPAATVEMIGTALQPATDDAGR